MPDPIYVDSIKVSAGPFTVRTSSDLGVIVTQNTGRRQVVLAYSLDEIGLLHRAISEYLHMRSMEDA